MTNSNTGAVFFLGTRAHYQVLQQPETRSYDIENGNASTETIYQNPSVQELWHREQMPSESTSYMDERNFNCYDNTEVTISDEKDNIETGNCVKRRSARSQSETTLFDRDNEMKPALLNNIGDSSTPKSKSSRRRLSVLSFLSSLARRKRRLDTDQIQYLQHLESALNTCTYRESCRCLDCQSRYFECDDSEDYSSEDSDGMCVRYALPLPQPTRPAEDEDDEVFVDNLPGDNVSTDLLIDNKEPPKMSVSSDEVDPEDGDMQLEVAAGTPVLLNYLLTHPITCAIQ